MPLYTVSCTATGIAPANVTANDRYSAITTYKATLPTGVADKAVFSAELASSFDLPDGYTGA